MSAAGAEAVPDVPVVDACAELAGGRGGELLAGEPADDRSSVQQEVDDGLRRILHLGIHSQPLHGGESRDLLLHGPVHGPHGRGFQRIVAAHPVRASGIVAQERLLVLRGMLREARSDLCSDHLRCGLPGEVSAEELSGHVAPERFRDMAEGSDRVPPGHAVDDGPRAGVLLHRYGTLPPKTSSTTSDSLRRFSTLLAARTGPGASNLTSPLIPVWHPPASSRIVSPAAWSHGDRRISKYSSPAPSAIRASSSAAVPILRMSLISGYSLSLTSKQGRARLFS